MRKHLHTRLGVLAVGAVVFTMVFAAAASLTVTSNALPQSGSDATAVCDADGVNVAYTIEGSTVTEIVVEDVECNGGQITIATSSGGYTFVETDTQSLSSSPTSVTYTLGAEGGAAAPVSIASFDPGTVTVTLVPNP
jgi:hypothetical protein